MTDEELRSEFADLRGFIEELAKTMADQQLLAIRLMAHQESLRAVVGNLLVQLGQNKPMLDLQLETVYKSALDLYHDQVESYAESGNVRKFLSSLAYPEGPQNN